MKADDEDASKSSSFHFHNILAGVVFVWYCFLWIISILGCLTARARYRSRPRSPLSSARRSEVPGVSILRPLKGLDTNLFENLESTFTQEYPNYEILLSVADADDQALAVVRSVVEKYPEVEAKVIIGEQVVGVNPKVNNLILPYKQAKNDILWVLDSNVLAMPGTLARSVDALTAEPQASTFYSRKKRVGLVHHVPFALVAEQALGSSVEEAFLNTNHAKMYIGINAAAVDSCVVGKSNMFRRSDVDQTTGDLRPRSDITQPTTRTGLAAFGRFLAEDNMIGAALWHELGLRHELSCDIASNTVGKMPFMAYVWRRVRWIRVRKRMSAAATLVEPLSESLALCLLGMWVFRYLLHISPWITLIVHYAAWIALDRDVFESLAGHPLPAERRWSFFAAWLMRESLALPIWTLAMFGNEVEWRGRRYEVMQNGEVRLADGRKSWSLLHWMTGKRNSYQPLDQDSA